MVATQVEAFRNDKNEALYDNQEYVLSLALGNVSITAMFVSHRLGVLILDELHPEYTDPKDIINVLLGCLDEESNLEDTLNHNYLLNVDKKYPHVEAILTRIYGTLILIKKNDSPRELNAKWKKDNMAGWDFSNA